MQHPATMHRMQDWNAELNKRIREQQEIDAQSSANSQVSRGWFGGGGGGESNQILDAFKVIGSELQPEKDSPLHTLGKAFSDSLSNLSSMLTTQDKAKEADSPLHSPGRGLPPQTFSRRL